MANVILDTNIYGKIVEDSSSDRLIAEIIRKDSFIIHDFKVIRDEVKRAPNVLKLYNQLVRTNLKPDTPEIDLLAKEYFKEYKKLGGVKKIKKIINDFKIVAYASVKNCDLVFSNDEKTMKHQTAKEAYKLVNLRKDRRTPTFYTYNELKKSLLGK